MLNFMIKKAFFDFWDHLFTVILINVGFSLLLAIIFYLLYLFRINGFLLSFWALAGFYLLNVYMGVVSQAMNIIIDYKQPDFKEFLGLFKDIWIPALIITLIVAPYIMILSLSAPFYLLQHNIIGMAGVSILFWITIIIALSLQYYYPIYNRLDQNLGKVLKKCFLVFIDNVGLSIYMGIGTIIIILISSLLGFILPGIGLIFIWINTGFKLRLYKYDYLEANPGANRRKIPWDKLLYDEKENVGKRTLKGIIFPWRDK